MVLALSYQSLSSVVTPAIDGWREELLAYFDTAGISNAPTEAMNLLIKKIKRTGHVFRNIDNYRIRLMLHCGVDWHTQKPRRPTAENPSTTVAS